jgi:hypothetical protein
VVKVLCLVDSRSSVGALAVVLSPTLTLMASCFWFCLVDHGHGFRGGAVQSTSLDHKNETHISREYRSGCNCYNTGDCKVHLHMEISCIDKTKDKT